MFGKQQNHGHKNTVRAFYDGSLFLKTKSCITIVFILILCFYVTISAQSRIACTRYLNCGLLCTARPPNYLMSYFCAFNNQKALPKYYIYECMILPVVNGIKDSVQRIQSIHSVYETHFRNFLKNVLYNQFRK